MTNEEKTVDWALGQKLAGGKIELAKELFEILINTLPQHKREITEAFKQKDLNQLAISSHKLHGATCYCGTPRLKKAVGALEHAAKNNEPERIDALYQTLCQEIDAVLKND